MNLADAKKLLSTLERDELRDHAFGDREMSWFDSNRVEIATGYEGSSASVYFIREQITFTGREAASLMDLGRSSKIYRNDVTGPDNFPVFPVVDRDSPGESRVKTATCVKCNASHPADEMNATDYPDGDTTYVCALCEKIWRATRIHDDVLESLQRRGSSIDELLTERYLWMNDAKPTREEIQIAIDGIKKEHPVYQRGTSFFIRRHHEPDLDVGTKIWRACYHHSNGSVRIDEFKPFPTTDRDVLVHATYGISFDRTIWTAFTARKAVGLACFSKTQPPENWTHFEVTGVAKTGRAVFVKPVVGTQEELLKQYPAPVRVSYDERAVVRALGETVLQGLREAVAPPPPKKPYICSSCAKNKKGSPGYGRCVVCRDETVPHSGGPAYRT